MFNHYEGWSLADLLVLRTQLTTQMASGQVTRTSIAGVSVEKAPFATSGDSQVITLKRVQYALWLLGEANVADGSAESNPYANPYTSTVKRTRANYV